MKDLSQEVRDVMRNNHWLALSTVSKEGVPQNSLVVYVSDGSIIYVHTSGDALKVRNIKENSRVGVVIPFYKNFLHRMVKKAPPAEIHFKGDVEILPHDAEEPREWFKKIIT